MVAPGKFAQRTPPGVSRQNIHPFPAQPGELSEYLGSSGTLSPKGSATRQHLRPRRLNSCQFVKFV